MFFVFIIRIRSRRRYGNVDLYFCGMDDLCGYEASVFSNPMIYLPLVLMGIDKIYKREKHGCLSGRLRFRLCRISISFI